MAYVIDADAFETGIGIFRDETKGHVIAEVWPQCEEVPEEGMIADSEAMSLARLFSNADELWESLHDMVEMFQRHIDGKPGPDDAAERFDRAREVLRIVKGN